MIETTTKAVTPNRSARVGKPTYIVLHRTQGTYESAVAWFKTPTSQVSADRVLSRDGKHLTVFNTVDSGLKCWAVGDGNSLCVSIEIEGMIGDEASLPENLFDSIAEQCIAISAGVKAHYGNTIPLTTTFVKGRPGITGHVYVGGWYGGSDHTCPGPNFPYARVVDAIRKRQALHAVSSWTVNAGDGSLLAKGVTRPALWGMKNWRAFRAHDQVTFRRHP